VALERLELHVDLTSLPRVHEWVYLTLRTITSPVFNEFVIWILGGDYKRGPRSIHSWKVVEPLLRTLAQRNPDFRVVFKGDRLSFLYNSWGIYDRVCSFVRIYLPVVLSNGFVKFEYVPHVDNPCWELRSL